MIAKLSKEPRKKPSDYINEITAKSTMPRNLIGNALANERRDFEAKSSSLPPPLKNPFNETRYSQPAEARRRPFDSSVLDIIDTDHDRMAKSVLNNSSGDE